MNITFDDRTDVGLGVVEGVGDVGEDLALVAGDGRWGPKRLQRKDAGAFNCTFFHHKTCQEF